MVSMKRILIITMVGILTLASCGNNTKNQKEMNTLSFNTEQAAYMSAIACNEAKADYTALAEAIDKGIDAGLTVSQVKEALSQLYAYTGFPRSLNALGTLQRVLDKRKAEGKATEEGEEASPLPGCRNNWHIHHGAVQVLVCVSGRGWFQEWGKPAVALVPGVIIAIPEGVKHWHGAAADSWMQHLTYHTDVKPGHSNEWLEPVTDEQYSIL